MKGKGNLGFSLSLLRSGPFALLTHNRFVYHIPHFRYRTINVTKVVCDTEPTCPVTVRLYIPRGIPELPPPAADCAKATEQHDCHTFAKLTLKSERILFSRSPMPPPHPVEAATQV
jgi:hypothetical protein